MLTEALEPEPLTLSPLLLSTPPEDLSQALAAAAHAADGVASIHATGAVATPARPAPASAAASKRVPHFLEASERDLGGFPLDGRANGGFLLDDGRQISDEQPISSGDAHYHKHAPAAASKRVPHFLEDSKSVLYSPEQRTWHQSHGASVGGYTMGNAPSVAGTPGAAANGGGGGVGDGEICYSYGQPVTGEGGSGGGAFNCCAK